jgi:hypothetical protein
MLRVRNPYAKLLNADGSLDRAAVMREAWALYRADRFAPKSGTAARRAFGRHLANAWDMARQGQANEARRQAEERAEAAMLAERARPSIALHDLPPLSLAGELELLRECSTDGRLPAARPQIAFAA